MKRVSFLTLKIIGPIIGVLGLVFLFLEGRILFSGDLLAYGNPVRATFATLYKIALALGLLFAAIAPFFLKEGRVWLKIYILAFAALNLYTLSYFVDLLHLNMPLLYLPVIVIGSLYFVFALLGLLLDKGKTEEPTA